MLPADSPQTEAHCAEPPICDSVIHIHTCRRERIDLQCTSSRSHRPHLLRCTFLLWQLHGSESVREFADPKFRYPSIHGLPVRDSKRKSKGCSMSKQGHKNHAIVQGSWRFLRPLGRPITLLPEEHGGLISTGMREGQREWISEQFLRTCTLQHLHYESHAPHHGERSSIEMADEMACMGSGRTQPHGGIIGGSLDTISKTESRPLSFIRIKPASPLSNGVSKMFLHRLSSIVQSAYMAVPSYALWTSANSYPSAFRAATLVRCYLMSMLISRSKTQFVKDELCLDFSPAPLRFSYICTVRRPALK
jgi:hypothetical protein